LVWFLPTTFPLPFPYTPWFPHRFPGWFFTGSGSPHGPLQPPPTHTTLGYTHNPGSRTDLHRATHTAYIPCTTPLFFHLSLLLAVVHCTPHTHFAVFYRAYHTTAALHTFLRALSLHIFSLSPLRTACLSLYLPSLLLRSSFTGYAPRTCFYSPPLYCLYFACRYSLPHLVHTAFSLCSTTSLFFFSPLFTTTHSHTWFFVTAFCAR